MKDIENKVLLRKVMTIFMDFVLFHILWVIITVSTAFLLYLIEYGKTESSLEILKSIISNTSGVIVILTIFVIYPTIWILAYSLLVNSKFNRIIVFSLIIRSLLWMSFHKEITQQMGYAFKYWYTPLIVNLDLFFCGFLLNPLIQNYKLNWNHRKSFFSKLIAVILIILLYLFTAHHLYHQELWNLPNRSGGWRTLTTILILQPLTAIITCFFIFSFEKEFQYQFLYYTNQSCFLMR